MRVEHQLIEGTLTLVDAERGALRMISRATNKEMSLRALPQRNLTRLQAGNEVRLLVQYSPHSRIPDVIVAQLSLTPTLQYLGAAVGLHALLMALGFLAIAAYTRTYWEILPATLIAVLYTLLSLRRAHALRTFARLLARRASTDGRPRSPGSFSAAS